MHVLFIHKYIFNKKIFLQNSSRALIRDFFMLNNHIYINTDIFVSTCYLVTKQIYQHIFKNHSYK